jgi:hypothetical protein
MTWNSLRQSAWHCRVKLWCLYRLYSIPVPMIETERVSMEFYPTMMQLIS